MRGGICRDLSCRSVGCHKNTAGTWGRWTTVGWLFRLAHGLRVALKGGCGILARDSASRVSGTGNEEDGGEGSNLEFDYRHKNSISMTGESYMYHKQHRESNAENGNDSKVTVFSRMCGFTLLELLVVMVIIGLLAGYVGPRYFSQIGKSEVKAARAQIDGLEKALDQYRLDTGHYPLTEHGLQALTERPSNGEKWSGPYLKKAVPPDPWGHPYVYRQPGEHGDFDLLSYGKDGQPGGSGEDADITNW